MRVGGIAHRIRPPLLVQIHMHDLMGGMNAGIGAPGAMDPHGRAGEARDRILDRLLHGETVGLMLPAGEGRAVIFDDELVARHVYSSSAKARA